MRTSLSSASIVAVGALVLGLVALGCSVGQGTGSVTGTLTVNACTFDSDGTAHPLPGPAYDLNADFFAGQPIDADIIKQPRFPANQMIIRVQHSGKRLESANALLFLLQDSAVVARCIHGAPGWDSALCDRSTANLGTNGEGRLLVGMTTETARSFLVLNDTCPKGVVSADALGVACEDDSCPALTVCSGRGSWVIFSDYGSVPTDTTVTIAPTFRVNDGERIRAQSFHVEMCDAGTVSAKLNHTLPVPKPNIVGTLEGSFDFPLERGQAGQPFP